MNVLKISLLALIISIAQISFADIPSETRPGISAQSIIEVDSIGADLDPDNLGAFEITGILFEDNPILTGYAIDQIIEESATALLEGATMYDRICQSFGYDLMYKLAFGDVADVAPIDIKQIATFDAESSEFGVIDFEPRHRVMSYVKSVTCTNANLIADRKQKIDEQRPGPKFTDFLLVLAVIVLVPLSL